jgi:hypothetical protein
MASSIKETKKSVKKLSKSKVAEPEDMDDGIPYTALIPEQW